jgi:hypothetical protein
MRTAMARPPADYLVCATIGGADDFASIEMFAKSNAHLVSRPTQAQAR